MRKLYHFILSACFISNVAFTQDIVGLEKLENDHLHYRTENPQEKVYLHFDKPYYYSGEDIWFQLYLVAGPSHQPSPISKVVYVELIHKSGNLLKRIKLPVTDGVTKGDFEIPSYFESGTYTIRAYTNWMRNFEEDFFFTKNIVIIRPYDGEAPIVENNSTLDIGFYPEGGDLIVGRKSKLAFKLFGSPAKTQQQEVKVFNAKDLLVDKAVTNTDGIGTIELIPNTEGHYARVNSTAKRFLLPAALAQGYSLAVDNLSDLDNILIKVAANFNDNKRRRGTVVVHSRGVILYSIDVTFVGQSTLKKIPKSELWTGVIQLTLFDQNWLAQAERLVFNDANDALKVDIKTDKSEYETRDSTVVSIKVTDQNGKPVQGNFSMAVLDSAQVNASLSREHILSNLLLTSDLNGHVHNPIRFFENAHDHSLQTELDKVMMTHGWRKFVWKDIKEKNYSHPFQAEKGIVVKGELFTGENGKAINKGTVSHIGSFEGKPSLAEAETTRDGKFTLSNLQFYENEENFLEGKRKNGKKGYTIIDSMWQTYPEVTPLALLYNELDTMFIQDHIEKSKERQFIKSLYDVEDNVRDLGEFVVEGSRKTKSGGQAYQYDFDEQLVFSQYATLFQMLGRNILPGITVEGPADYRRVYSDGIKLLEYYIDGVGYNDSTHGAIRAMPAWMVKSVSGGLLVVTRNEKELLDFFRAVGDKRVSALPGGYYKSREYFSPRYFPIKPEHDVPDKRVLIHWQPLIRTDERGEAQITIFNTDLNTTVNIYLEGLSDNGIAGFGLIKYKVKFKN